MADTAALVVALSAQLTKFEADMKNAVKIADTNVNQIEQRFSKMNSTISNEFSGFIGNYASQAGALGRVLTSIGPLGLTIAAGIGAATLALDFLIQKTEQYVQKQKELKETSEITGLSLNQLKAIGEIGKRVGVDSETTTGIIVKLGTALEQLKTTGTGPLFESLLKLGGNWLQQVSGAKDLAEAIEILSRAFESAATSGQKLQLAASIGGRRQAGPTARLLTGVSESGGLDVVQKQLQAAGLAIDDVANKKLVALQLQLEETRRKADTVWGRAFAPEIMQYLIRYNQLWLSIGSGIEKAAEAGRRAAEKQTGQSLIATLFQQKTPLNAPVTPVERGGDLAPAIDKESEALQRHKDQVASDLGAMQKWMGVLGDGVTLMEQHTAALLRIENAEINEGLASDKAARARKVADDQLQIGTDAIRERLGVATQLQITEAKATQTRADANKANLTEAETLKALAKSALDAEKAFEAMAIAASRVPGITRYAFDSTFVKQFDQTFVSLAGNFENALGSIANGTTTLKDAFRNMANSIISDLVRMTIRLSVTGPLSGALSGLFGAPTGLTTGPTQIPNPFTGKFFASGGSVSAGSPIVVGEKGPELFVPGSSGQIIPNGVSGGTSAGLKVTVNNFASGQVDTTQEQRGSGPNVEELVIGIVRKTLASGDADSSQRGRYGLRPAKVR